MILIQQGTNAITSFTWHFTFKLFHKISWHSQHNLYNNSRISFKPNGRKKQQSTNLKQLKTHGLRIPDIFSPG